jgi:DNA-binding transcriptional LysR family regulator
MGNNAVKREKLNASFNAFKPCVESQGNREMRQSAPWKRVGGHMDVHQLEVFLAVMDSSSVTRAAEKIHLSPGAVSIQLHNLASEVQAELFVHQGNRLVPTPAAARLADHARQVVKLMKQIGQEFEADSAKDTRPFQFATGVTTLIYQLGSPLRRLRKQFPNADIRVTVGVTEQIVAGLLDRRFDLGLISLPVSEDALQMIPLFAEELLVIRPSAQSVGTTSIGLMPVSELASASFLLYPQRSNVRRVIDQFFRKLNVSPRVSMEADDTEAIKRLVESGFGYSILPAHALREQTCFFETFRVEDHLLHRSLALAMARTEYPRKLTECIADFLRMQLAPADGHGGVAPDSKEKSRPRVTTDRSLESLIAATGKL